MTSFLERVHLISLRCDYMSRTSSLLLFYSQITLRWHVFQSRGVIDKVLVYCVIMYISSISRTQERKSVITLHTGCMLFLVFLLCSVQVFLVRNLCRHNTQHGRHVFNLSLVFRMLEFDQSPRRAFNTSEVNQIHTVLVYFSLTKVSLTAARN